MFIQRKLATARATAAVVGALLLLSGLTVQAQSTVQESGSASDDIAHNRPGDIRRGDVWIVDVGALLDQDRDADGFFSRFSLSLDADVDPFYDSFGYAYVGEARVFARLSLTDTQGIERLIFDSDRFDLFGNSSGDRYRIEFDLRADFPQDRYDIVIELREARSDDLLDVVDASVFRTLSNLPLEDAISDGRVVDDGSAVSFVAVETSGAVGPWLLLLAGLGLRARYRCERTRSACP